jgi:catechol 2,3-dioxygenase-like lactoylglutathione lyase family enzyme
VTVSDINRAIELYSNELGVKIADRLSLESEGFNRIIGLRGRATDIAFLDAGRSKSSCLSTTNRPERKKGVGDNDIGVSHVSLSVDDIREKYEALVNRVEFLSEPQTLQTVRPSSGCWIWMGTSSS